MEIPSTKWNSCLLEVSEQEKRSFGVGEKGTTKRNVNAKEKNIKSKKPHTPKIRVAFYTFHPAQRKFSRFKKFFHVLLHGFRRRNQKNFVFDAKITFDDNVKRIFEIHLKFEITRERVRYRGKKRRRKFIIQARVGYLENHLFLAKTFSF